MGRSAARAGRSRARQSSGSPQTLPGDGHSQLARCPRGTRAVPSAWLGAVTDPRQGSGWSRAGRGGSGGRKCQCSLTRCSQGGKGVPWKEPPGPKPLLGQTGMAAVATSGPCQPFNGARVCWSRGGGIRAIFLSTKSSVKPRHDSSRPSFSAAPVLSQCTGKPTQDIPQRPFSPARPRGHQPTLCHISRG